MPHRNIGPDDLYRYVASIAKKKQIKFDELANRMQMSKTTLWRYMKGMNAFTPELEKRISLALEIGDEQREELRRLISINLVDSSLVAARYTLDKFMFGDSTAPLRPTELDFTYYGETISQRKSSDIIREIMSLTQLEDCECEAWVINCTDGAALENITYLLGSLIPSAKAGTIEQLVAMPDKNYRRNIQAFISLLPLLRVNGYRARLARSQAVEQSASQLKNMALIKISYAQSGERKERFYALTINTSSACQCLCFEDRMNFEFLKANYDNFKRSYSNEMPDEVNLCPMGQEKIDFEMSGDFAMIRHDPSYNSIPPEVWQSMAARMTEYDVEAFAQSLCNPNNIDANKKLKECLSFLKKRYKNTSMHKSVFVHSRTGLEQFARTGLVRDPLAAFPAFTRREIRRILENFKTRMMDENDPFEMYITYKDFLFQGQVFSASAGAGALIDIGMTKRLKGINNNLLINDPQLADTIVDYATNHIPAYHALETSEAVAYIDSLISRYTD